MLRGECQKPGFVTRQRRLCLFDPNGQAVVEGSQIGVLPLPCLALTALYSEACSCRRHGFGERFNTLSMGRALLTDLAAQRLGLSVGRIMRSLSSLLRRTTLFRDNRWLQQPLPRVIIKQLLIVHIRQDRIDVGMPRLSHHLQHIRPIHRCTGQKPSPQ